MCDVLCCVVLCCVVFSCLGVVLTLCWRCVGIRCVDVCCVVWSGVLCCVELYWCWCCCPVLRCVVAVALRYVDLTLFRVVTSCVVLC